MCAVPSGSSSSGSSCLDELLQKGLEGSPAANGASFLDELLKEGLEGSPAASAASSTVSQLVASFLDAGTADLPPAGGESFSCLTSAPLPASNLMHCKDAMLCVFQTVR